MASKSKNPRNLQENWAAIPLLRSSQKSTNAKVLRKSLYCNVGGELLVNLCSKNRRVNNKRVNNANEAKNEAIVVATLDSFRASSDINFTSYEGRSNLISVVSTRSLDSTASEQLPQ